MNSALARQQLAQIVSLHRQGKIVAAAASYTRLLPHLPESFDAWHLAGLCALQINQAPLAVQRLLKARQLQPENALCLMRLGVALTQIGQTAPAIATLRSALTRDPESAETLHHLAKALRQDGNLPEAIKAAQQAVRLRPGYAEAYDRLGSLTIDQKGFAAAIPYFREAVAARTSYAPGWCNLGLALAQTGDDLGALSCFNESLSLAPHIHLAKLGRGLARQQLYQLPGALADFDAMLAAEPNHPEAISAKLLTLNYSDRLAPAEVSRMHRELGARLGPPDTDAPPAPEVTAASVLAERPLRVGFVSPDFRNHAVAQFFGPLLAKLDRTRFDVFLYPDHPLTDAVSAQLQALATQWKPINGWSHERVLRHLRHDALDIVIDLTGHTGRNRLPVFARRAAPVQISYLGYPHTTGVSAMDFRLVDATTDPAVVADAQTTETLLRFAPCAWTWSPPPAAPEVAPLPVLKNGYWTFGSFNNFAKVSTTTLDAWATILHELPNSRLVLKSHGLEKDAVRADILQRFRALAIESERIDLIGRQPTTAGHLDLYRRIDIALDPFPYHGTTTTCEALWMGRPVLTRYGDTHASRVGLSLLRTVGHGHWAAADEPSLVELASDITRDPASLQALSQRLRDDVRHSPLCDATTQAGHFGRALIEAFNRRATTPALTMTG